MQPYLLMYIPIYKIMYISEITPHFVKYAAKVLYFY